MNTNSQQDPESSYLKPSPSLTPSNPGSISSQSVGNHDDIPLLKSSCQRADSFHTELRQARIRCSPTNSHKSFVPKSEIERLTTTEKVFATLCKAFPERRVSELQPYAARISTSAPYLFATLGYIHREREILPLLDEEVSDEDFHFEIQTPQPTGHQ